MGSDWFTADLHLGHPFIASLRGFSSVEEHDRAVVDAINSRVGRNDRLYVLGDVCSGSASSCQRAFAALDELHVPPKRRVLVLGNHDSGMSHAVHAGIAERFWLIQESGLVHVQGLGVAVLSHFPKLNLEGVDVSGLSVNAASFPSRSLDLDDETLLLHGHIHSSKPVWGGAGQVDVGLDAWGLKPVSSKMLADLVGGLESWAS